MFIDNNRSAWLYSLCWWCVFFYQSNIMALLELLDRGEESTEISSVSSEMEHNNLNGTRSNVRKRARMVLGTAIVAAVFAGCGGGGSKNESDDDCVKLADDCVSPSGSVQVPDTSESAKVLNLGDTGAKLIIPKGASLDVVDIQWSVHNLTKAEREVDGLKLLPQEINFAPSGTEFEAPLLLEMPMSWPSDYDDMTTGVHVVWVPAYTRGDDGTVERDTLTSMERYDGGAGWVILDATKSSRKATALVVFDHFSSHTVVMPSPEVEFDGQAAFTERDVTGSTVPLTVPTGLFSHSAIDILTLNDTQTRRDLYKDELMELVRQTTPEREALWHGYDEIFEKLLDVTDAAGLSKKLGLVADGLSYQQALFENVVKAKDRAEKLAHGFKKLSNSMAKIEDSGKIVQVSQCLSDGILQLWVLTTLDDELVAARWAAVKDKLVFSPLGEGDEALIQAILDVDDILRDASSDTLLDTINKYIEDVSNGNAVPSCVNFAAGAVAGLVSKIVVTSLLAEAKAAAKTSMGMTLTAGAAVALAEFLIEDWLTKDAFNATQNAQRLSILVSLLKSGNLGRFPDLGSSLSVSENGVVKVSVPDVLDYTEDSSTSYLRLQVASYAQKSIFETISQVVQRDDMSLLSQFFDNWKNVWCHASDSCPSGWGIGLLADSFDQAAQVNETTRLDLVSTFASCYIPGYCSAACHDPDNDGYGDGKFCFEQDCAPNDASVYMDCSGGAGGEGGGSGGEIGDGGMAGAEDGGSAGIEGFGGHGGEAGKSGDSGLGGVGVEFGAGGRSGVGGRNGVGGNLDEGGNTSVGGTLGEGGENINVGGSAGAVNDGNITGIASGYYHTCAIVNGGVQCWGNNEYGQLGDNSVISTRVPVHVYGLTSGVTSIVASDEHTCAIVNGGVKCWGLNSSGELGDGSTVNSSIPVQVYGLTSEVISVGTEAAHTCALVNGGMQCWGSNSFGQLGNNSAIDSSVPVQVQGLMAGVTDIAVAGGYTCAVVNGGVKCWGYNGYGVLGDGSTTTILVPVYIPNQVEGIISGATSVAVGNLNTCALVNEEVQCWGDNQYEQLGDGFLETRSSVPVQIDGLNSGVTNVSIGYGYVCVLINDGVQCWGNNELGQLGNNSTINSSVPVQVNGLISGVVAISVGCNHSCAIVNGGVQCWGDNDDGELGNNTKVSSPFPVSVQFP
jgi:alpha-tubulin suppressor-like RCC1 family protein